MSDDRVMHLVELITYFITVVFATDAALRAWFYGSLFQKWREYFYNKPGLLGDLLSCPFCLSYHVVFWLFALTYTPSLFLAQPWKTICLLPTVILAAISCFHWFWHIRPEYDNDEDKKEDDTK